ncbi:MAG: TatD family hydrolase [Rikenellaceae bacterium]
MIKYIDTHAHLYDEAFDQDRAEVVARALKSGVEMMLLPDVDSTTRPRMVAMAEAYPRCTRMMVGLHPTSVGEMDWRAELAEIEQLLCEGHERFIAIGEIGLDLYWRQDNLADQIEAMERQIELALEYDKPVAIHTREAQEPMRELLLRYKGRGLRGVMHAFSGSVEDYRALKGCADLLFAIGGVATFKRAAIADVAAQIALEDLLLETDAPYLTPVPFRGKRNESAYIPYICEHIAKLKGISPEELARVTSENGARLFANFL